MILEKIRKVGSVYIAGWTSSVQVCWRAALPSSGALWTVAKVHSAAPGEQHHALPSSSAAVSKLPPIRSPDMHSNNGRRSDVRLSEISYPVLVSTSQRLIDFMNVYCCHLQDVVLTCKNLQFR
jgi:hypothetical protein